MTKEELDREALIMGCAAIGAIVILVLLGFVLVHFIVKFW